ncbi:MAG: chromosome segregation protein ScpA [Planctomycetaceae bacterium]|nr:chromosome segregation protein ScpA [Planctomycetaceae bacterium]
MPYNVALDTFHGPLDLLLFLVRRNEVDVLDIPIAQLTDQFLEYLRLVQAIDVEFAGEFLVMAATLMEIKSRMLLPDETQASEEQQADPRRELVRQLLEYRKFKDAASALEERAEEQGTRISRQELPEPSAATGPIVKPVELWDLVSAFARLMRETQSLQTATIAVDDTPQHVYEEMISERVRNEGRVRFIDVFTQPFFKAKLIGIFLAVLELVRHHGLGLELGEVDTDIWLVQLPDPVLEEDGADQPGGTTLGGSASSEDGVPSSGLS